MLPPGSVIASTNQFPVRRTFWVVPLGDPPMLMDGATCGGDPAPRRVTRKWASVGDTGGISGGFRQPCRSAGEVIAVFWPSGT